MTQRNPSKITTDLAVDDALVQDASFELDADDRQYLDNQIRGGQQHLVDMLIRGVHATYVRLSGSSANVVAGDTVCLASAANVTEPTVTKCTSGALTNAPAAVGVVLRAGSAGAWILVAFGGVVPPTVTGLAAGAPGYVRVNTATSQCERVASLATSDYGIGTVDNAGWLLVSQYLALGSSSPLVSGSLNNNSTGTVNDVSTASVGAVRFTHASGATVTGFADGSANKLLVVYAAGGADVTINHEDAGSVAANRIITYLGGARTIYSGTFGLFSYDATSSRWRMGYA